MKTVAPNLKTSSKLPVKLLLAICFVISLSGCATHVEVSGTFPKPLSRQYPFTTTLVFNEDFRSYRFENLAPREVSVAVGDTQVQLFQAVSGSMFKGTEVRDLMPESATTDLIFKPTVADVQIAMPYETQLKVFEVWIKYKIELFDHNSELIAAWVMPAYGKTPTRFLKSESDALNQATMVALRDAGANLITSFGKVPQVKAWLATQSAKEAVLTP